MVQFAKMSLTQKSGCLFASSPDWQAFKSIRKVLMNPSNKMINSLLKVFVSAAVNFLHLNSVFVYTAPNLSTCVICTDKQGQSLLLSWADKQNPKPVYIKLPCHLWVAVVAGCRVFCVCFFYYFCM